MLPIDQTNLIVNGCIPAGKRAFCGGPSEALVYVLKAEIKGSGIFSNYKAKQEIRIVAARSKLVNFYYNAYMVSLNRSEIGSSSLPPQLRAFLLHTTAMS